MGTLEGQLLWTPAQERIDSSACGRFLRWLATERGRKLASFEELRQWSVSDTEGYWRAVWDHARVPHEGHLRQVCDTTEMRPGVHWFSGVRLNYAEHLLNAAQTNPRAVMHLSETRPLDCLSGEELGRKVRLMASNLRAWGLRPGDRVCAMMPNIPETVIAMLSSISVAATWSNAAPEFGAQSIVDRFSQVRPRVLFVADGYRYGGRDFDRRGVIEQVIAQLPSVELVVWLPYLDPSSTPPPGCREYASLLQGEDPGSRFRFERVEAHHPLWVVFSSGTSGPPKAIVHGHIGGILGMRNFSHFHMDIQPEDTVFFYTTTGWIMFNFMVSLLMNGATSVLYDGDPLHPKDTFIWELAVATGATQLGGSPTYVEMLRSRGIVPKQQFDLSRLKAYSMSGAPCQPETMAWCYDNLKDDLWVNNFSGGTEIAGPLVAGSPMLPVRAGEIQARALGMAVEAFDEEGRALVGSVGELVCTKPFPSMPLYFLNDAGDRRYKETYFERFPGAWCHGDLLKVNERGGCYIYGRADSTLNRRGIRIGTAEIYRAVEGVEGIADSMAVCINEGGVSDVMVLFVVLKPDFQLDAAMIKAIQHSLRTRYSPRHVPDRIEQVPRIPYTLTGKKMEIPVRKILSGIPPERVASRDAIRDPEALDYFVAKHASWTKGRGNAPSA